MHVYGESPSGDLRKNLNLVARQGPKFEIVSRKRKCINYYEKRKIK